MKRIILLIFVFFLCFKSIAQTYTMTLSYQAQNLTGCNTNFCAGCERWERNWKMGNYIAPYNEAGFVNTLAQYPYNNNLNTTQITINIPENNYDVFYFTNYSERCFMSTNQPVDCKRTQTLSAKFQTELYESTTAAPVTATSSCFGIIKVLSYTANLSLNIPTKYRVTYTNEEYENYFRYGIPLPDRGATVCAGEAIELTASPLGFKRATYNWQYKVKNGTWKNFKYKKNADNSETTYLARPTFTIAEILNTEDETYTGFIDIRLGSGQNGAFTGTVKLFYTPCTLVIKNTEYLAPDCNGGRVKSIVASFEGNLGLNEVLWPLRIIPYPKANGDTPKFEQDPVTSLVYNPITQWYTYSFKIPEDESLQNRWYTIEYQSQVNGVPKGTLTSSVPFLYEDPTPVKFEIKQALDPLCNNNSVEIALNVTGGTESYKFYVDGTEKTPTPVKEADGYYHLRGLNPNAANIIKVTDTKDCIEK